jgi:hypothetical protein
LDFTTHANGDSCAFEAPLQNDGQSGVARICRKQGVGRIESFDERMAILNIWRCRYRRLLVRNAGGVGKQNISREVASLVICTTVSRNGPAGLCSQVWARELMKITLNIVASLLVLLGAIWFLQGINVLPGSFMTGQSRWAFMAVSPSQRASLYC